MNTITALTLYISCTLIISSCSDSKTKAQPEEQKEKGTEKQATSIITEKHVKIPNSSLYIIPPAGFAADETSGTLAQTEGTAHYMQMQIFSGETQESLFAKFKSEAEKQSDGNNKTESKADTARMASFPGTAIYIQLPKGFVWNETAMGFYKEEDGSVIKYNEFKKMRYAANMSAEETMGSLINQQPITINGYKGVIKTYQQGSTGIQLDLSFGDASFMEFVEATYFSHQEQTAKDILAALKTIQVKK